MIHVEDLEELRQTTPRTVWNWRARKDVHPFVVDEILDQSPVERKADIEEPH